MKRKALALCMFGLAVFLTGCWQKSVHPFYKDKDVAFEPLLLGTWNDPEKKPDETETWAFTRGDGESVYRVNIHDKETHLDFDGRLFKMGDHRFLDLHSRKRSLDEIPAHHLFRVRGIGPSLELQLLSLDWVRDRLQVHPKEIANIYLANPEKPDAANEGQFVLTAGTDQLQKFVLDHLDAEGFFGERMVLKKTDRP